MPIAISAWFDGSADLRVRAVWKRIAEANLDTTLHDGPYRPHITLGIWNDLAIGDAVILAENAVAGRDPLRIRFEVVGMFVSPDPAVFLAPTVSAELRTLHEHLHSAARATSAVPLDYHVPGRWNPHCTVAWKLAADRLPAAVSAALADLSLPLDATIEQLGVIETPTEIVHASVTLAGGNKLP